MVSVLLLMNILDMNMHLHVYTGITKHWCQDQYTQGGTFTQYTPHQETKLKGLLSTSVDNVHFTGEHISSAHAW
jgi:monoamine oxidase